jgi:hypothetical protein
MDMRDGCASRRARGPRAGPGIPHTPHSSSVHPAKIVSKVPNPAPFQAFEARIRSVFLDSARSRSHKRALARLRLIPWAGGLLALPASASAPIADPACQKPRCLA